MKLIKLKKTAIATVISLQLFGFSQVATADSKVPEISPIMYDTLGGGLEGAPLFIDVGSDSFLLEKDKWQSIQMFAESAVGLPNSEAAFRSATRYPNSTPLNNHYIALMGTFGSIYSLGESWNRKIYPDAINLATKLANYSDIHLALIQPFINGLTSLQNASLSGDLTAAEQNRQTTIAFLNTFINFVDGNLTSTELLVDQIIAFQSGLTTQSGQLNQSGVTLGDILNKEEPANIRSRIVKLKEKIAKLNEDISDKERDIALTAIGGPLALLIGGSIQGAQLDSLKDAVKDIESQISTQNKELAHASKLATSYEVAKYQVEGMNTKIKDALRNVRSIQVHWQALHSDMSSLRDVLKELDGENGLRNANVVVAGIVSSPLASNASNSWINISNKAKAFLQNAYLPISKQ
jgi:hypothetical protein